MPFIELGVYFADHLFTKDIEKFAGTFTNRANQDNETFNKFDWGIAGGVGVIKKIGRGYFSINARFDYSIANELQNPSITLLDAQTNQYVTYKQTFLFSVLSFGINYTYPLKLDKKLKQYERNYLP